MDLLARFVGIWMVFVFYTAVDVEGANYGESCTADSDCLETNAAKCDTGDTGNCICEDTYFRKTTAAECASRVNLNAACEVEQTSPEQCTVANSECIDVSGTINCICSTTHFETGGACALKKALTESCAAVAECADPNAECPSSTCVCKSNYFTNKNDVCNQVISTLAGTCDATDSAGGQCTFTSTECRDDGAGGQCLCIATSHYSDGSACQTRIAYGLTCSNTVTDTNQCAVTNQVCSLDTGTAYKCQCTAAYYDDDGTSGCTARKKPAEGCAVGQCVTDATCNTVDGSLKCECDAGFTAKPADSPTMCSGVAKFATLSYMYVVPILVSMMFLLR